MRDPLFLFFIAGLGLFGVFSILNNGEDANPVTISEAGLAVMLEDYRSLTGREPDAIMREAIVQDYYRREVLYREGLRQDVVRESPELREALITEMQQRVSGKLDEPSAADLVAFYTEHIDRYYREAHITFEQYFVTEAPADPQHLIEALAAGEALPGKSHRTGQQFPTYGESMIRGLFGPEVLGLLQAANFADWFGPIETIEGWHFFRVSDRGARVLQPFERVSSEVLIDYQSSQLDSRVDAFIDSVGDRYPLLQPDAALP